MINFFTALLFSFIGSIPPGAINISVTQFALEGKIRAALRFSIAAAIVEFPYVLIAIRFSELLLSEKSILENIKLISTLLIFALALINTYAYFKKAPKQITADKGFRKGLLISIFNPLAIPFWIGVTAYLTSHKWINIITWQDHLIYASGVSAGTFIFLVTIIVLANNFQFRLRNQKLAKLIPAIIFYLLGIYSLLQLI